MFRHTRTGMFKRRMLSVVLMCTILLLTGCGSKTFTAEKQLDIGVIPELPCMDHLEWRRMMLLWPKTKN